MKMRFHALMTNWKRLQTIKQDLGSFGKEKNLDISFC